MRIVVDTNILFSYFWEKSVTKRLLETLKFELISPGISLNEINEYKREIINKTGISDKKFSTILSSLKKTVRFIDKISYKSYLKEAEKTSPDKSDADFFALCLKERAFLWSNDYLLKEQTKVRVFSTKEIIGLLFD